MPEYNSIRLEIDGPVATLFLDRPDKLNAMDVAILDEMKDAIARIDGDESIRAVVLTGAGRSFCAGADLTMELAEGRSVADHLNEDHRPVLMAVRESPKPWISAVNGACAGIGSAHAMNCDLTVMAEDAFLYQAFAAIGLVPDGAATWHLTNTVGRKLAYEMIATGDRISAARCLELGLCNRVVPAADLVAEAQAWAHTLAKRAPLSLRFAKQAVWTAAEGDLPTTYDQEVELQTMCNASDDFREGVRAFMEKRTPEFKGR